MRLLALLAAALAIAAALWATRRPDVEPPSAANEPAAANPAAGAATPPPIVGDVAPPKPAAARPADARAAANVRFPDGSTRPALNGVTADLAIDWPSGRPYAPVTGVVVNSEGVAFWQHADGSFTTTVVRTETRSGQEVQIPLCYTPGPAPGELRLRQ